MTAGKKTCNAMFYATPTEGELDSFSTKENQFHLRGVQPPSAEDNAKPRLQALVSDILPSTTAVFSYATEGSLFISAQLSTERFGY